MTSLPLVTIGLPCCNAERWLEECVTSVLAQTFSDWELIAVDDGSTDRTPAILRTFDDPRIRVVADGVNLGRCARLNQIAESANGKYLARMDADDVMLPERIEKQVAFLEAHPDVDLLGGGLISIDAQGRPKGWRCLPERINNPRRILKGEALFHPTVMATTQWFRTHPYIEGYIYSDDFALWTKYAETLTIANLREPLIKYREHELFTYDKYRGRSRETLRALHELGSRWLAPRQLRTLVFRRRLKDTVYWLFHATGLWGQAYRLSRRKRLRLAANPARSKRIVQTKHKETRHGKE